MDDVAEDIEHLYHGIEDFMNPKSPLMSKGIELDAKLRFSPAVQKMIKMFFDDMGIKNWDQLGEALERIGERVETDIENCPYFRRMRLAAERMIRYAINHLRIEDVPAKGSMRTEWANRFINQVYDVF